jgi:hypothetical protein
MFEIDFFSEAKKAQQPHYLVVIGMTIALLAPLVVASGVTIKYFEYKTELPAIKLSLENRNAMLEKMHDYETTLNVLGSERVGLVAKLNEVADEVDQHIQWSQALASLAEGVPDDVVIVNIDLKREPIKAPSGQTLRYEYKLSIGAIVLSSPAAMQRFMQFLRFSWNLKSSTRNVQMPVQSRILLEGKDLPLYLIECTWEP